MPVYEYKCPKCGHFEVEQPITAEVLSTCPKCGKPIKKLISRSAVIFKGSGFYVTDNRKPDHKSEAGGDSSQSPSSSKDSKPSTDAAGA
ncbi:MAG TPA: FmdB family zinc ribbon protein [Bacillota bacterium]